MKSKRTSIDDCKLVGLPKIVDSRGNLTSIESQRHVDFKIKRIYYLYDVPGGAERGGHAHKNLFQLIVAISGSFDVVLDDGENRKIVQLNRGDTGLTLSPYIWREINNFSTGAVCLVLASDYYYELDYIRDYEDFMSIKKTTE